METKDRNDLIQYGLTLVNEGLTTGSGGNLSVRSDDSKSFFITPSGMAYDVLKKSDLVHMDPEGNLLGGTRKPSSEWPMHAAIYRARPDIRALLPAQWRVETVNSVEDMKDKIKSFWR